MVTPPTTKLIYTQHTGG